MKKKPSAIVVLTLVAIIAALLLSVTNEITKGPIQEQAVKDAENARKQLLPETDLFEEIGLSENASIETCYVGKKEGEPIGYVAQITVTGFGGPIEVTVGVDTVGTLAGIEVGGSEFSETAGLGAKAKDDAFKKQFAGLTTPVAVGDQIDAITAATITSNAVTRGVNAAVEAVGEIAGFAIAKNVEGGALGNGRYSATVDGFDGPVYVELQLDEAGVITEIIIGDERFNETPGFGAKAQEAAFYEQFIGLSSPIELSKDVDAISGATITSKAVVDAVNLACLYASDPDAAQVAASAAVEEIVLPEIPENARRADASAQGFAGPVFVEIALDDADQIIGLTIGDDHFAETKGFGANALETAFIAQFIGMSLPVGIDDIDAISGATITTEAVVEAINEAAGQLIEMPETEEPVAEEKEADEETVEGETLSASAQGFAGPVFVEITVDADDIIQGIKIGDESFAETKGFGANALESSFTDQFIGKKLPVAIEDIDALTGATITTTAVIEAINAAYAEPEESNETTGRVAGASAQGFAGPVFVEITVDADDTIQGIKIGDESFAETKGFGANALESTFTDQFIGKKLPVAVRDVDALTGATITTVAVVEAINVAYALDVELEESKETTDRVASASAQGFAGPVFVEITIDSDDTIQGIKIGDESFTETKGFGANALESSFTDQFIGKKLPVAIEDIDALTSATITTTAVIEAVNAAHEQLAQQ